MRCTHYPGDDKRQKRHLGIFHLLTEMIVILYHDATFLALFAFSLQNRHAKPDHNSDASSHYPALHKLGNTWSVCPN